MKFLISAMAIFLLGACSNLDENTATFGRPEKWIPADFDPRTSTLLVRKHPWSGKKFQEKMEAYMKEKYPYAYEFYDYNAEPKDLSKYKFRVVWGTMSTYVNSKTPGGSHVVGHFEDIATDKKYPEPRYSNYVSLGYMPFFNSIIKKYKTK